VKLATAKKCLMLAVSTGRSGASFRTLTACESFGTLRSRYGTPYLVPLPTAHLHKRWCCRLLPPCLDGLDSYAIPAWCTGAADLRPSAPSSAL